MELHSKELKIENISVVINNEILKISKYEEDSKREMLQIYLEQEIKNGQQFELYIQYEGSLKNRIVGFYRSSYTKTNGSKR